MVENEETFDRILPSFLKWLQNTENDFGRNMTKTFIICGDWDLRIMLPDQCQMSNITVPPVMTQWLNLKKVNYKFIYIISNNYRPVEGSQVQEYEKKNVGILRCRPFVRLLGLVSPN